MSRNLQIGRGLVAVLLLSGVPTYGAAGTGDTESTTPELLLEALGAAMSNRDLTQYGLLLDPEFRYTVTCASQEFSDHQLGEELAIMEKLFEHFTSIEAEFTVEDSQAGDNGQIVESRMRILLVDDNGDGSRLDQFVTLSLSEDDAGSWRIRQWLDRAPDGGDECSEGARWSVVRQSFVPSDTAIETTSYGAVKRRLAR